MNDTIIRWLSTKIWIVRLGFTLCCFLIAIAASIGGLYFHDAVGLPSFSTGQKRLIITLFTGGITLIGFINSLRFVPVDPEVEPGTHQIAAKSEANSD